jgi:hypothetical protein
LNQEIKIGSSPDSIEQTTVVLIPSLRSAPNRNGFITGFSVLTDDVTCDEVDNEDEEDDIEE